ncbi:hypothetical protein Pla108_21710 [Botrimarina colliarenosi]|uniref:AAA+ ATPase domain-containing protein n=1 Tax=Botrimarina colliarenosi TaxID=2528001 RepID=A0A5C6AF06_9BACT|nr:hypothetical protein [Botrimarina colliarenosi]TWT98016.1 hypothetical protein Pla108_21710 [Botrimarina colliarenosi]
MNDAAGEFHEARPPSRESNPFSTCWTRPGALDWAPSPSEDVALIVDRLRQADWRGQIVGPHGSGKSTLLHALVEPLRQLGRHPRRYDVTDATEVRPGELLLVEAFERAPLATQRRLVRSWRSAGVGFVVTTHSRWRNGWRPLRVIASPRPTASLVATLFAQLTTRVATPVTLEDALDSFASRGTDLRRVWFDLYNLHEQRTRDDRTSEVVATYWERPVGLQGSDSSCSSIRRLPMRGDAVAGVQ